MVYGLTGPLCAGKDLAAEVLRRRGWLIVDEDAVGHLALEAQADEIVSAFGEDMLDASGEISRRRLGEVVFETPEALEQLESIVHPWMVEETRRRLEERTVEHAAINAAILFKMGLDALCDRVILVRSPAILRFLRCLRRDDLSPARVVARMRAQRALNSAPDCADTVTVWNIGTRRAFERRISRAVS